MAMRYKARLVERENFKTDVTTLAKLYAPVADIEVVQLILSIAVLRNWDISQLDVKDAYLHALLPVFEQIWIRLPKIDGIPIADGRIVKLFKSLYDLCQAPKLWN